MLRSPLLFLILFFTIVSGYAQNITGTWEGRMGNEFIQLNVEQKGNELCGYSYDYQLSNRRDYCRSYFTGSYNTKKSEWVTNGHSFFQNSGTHVLMRIRLWRDPDGDPDVLQGLVFPKGALSILSFGLGTPVELKKVSNMPTKLPGGKDPCPEPEKKTDPNAPDPRDLVKTPPPRPKPEPQPVVKDTSVKPIIVPPVVKPTPAPVPEVVIKKPEPLPVTQRKNKAITRVNVNVKTITLSVYDNATIDGDTVSIFFDGKLLVDKKRLTDKALEVTLNFDTPNTTHELVMFAENLGSIPPNTALIVFYIAGKRYELFASASLEENAVLVFEYKPDP